MSKTIYFFTVATCTLERLLAFIYFDFLLILIFRTGYQTIARQHFDIRLKQLDVNNVFIHFHCARSSPYV